MNLEERIITTLKNNMERLQEINIESKLKEDLALDSFDILMVISALEDEFSITINEEDFSEVVTVGDIVDRMRAVNKKDKDKR